MKNYFYILVFTIFLMVPLSGFSQVAESYKSDDTTIAGLKKGDKILTRGGLYGKIVNFQGKNDNKVTIDAGSGVKLNISRSYIAGLASNSENEKPDNAS